MAFRLTTHSLATTVSFSSILDAGISLADALNFLVEKSELVRIDRPSFSIQHQSPFISAIDILRARKAIGLMQRTGNKAVTCAISGRSSGGLQ